MSKNTFETSVIVRSYELDSYGHVNNAVYLNYLEAARSDMLRQVGMSFNDFKKIGAFPVVVEANVRYRSPSFADDVLIIKTTMAEVRRATCLMDFEVHKKDGTLVLTAQMEFLFMGNNGRPTRMPDVFKESFSKNNK